MTALLDLDHLGDDPAPTRAAPHIAAQPALCGTHAAGRAVGLTWYRLMRAHRLGMVPAEITPAGRFRWQPDELAELINAYRAVPDLIERIFE